MPISTFDRKIEIKDPVFAEKLVSIMEDESPLAQADAGMCIDEEASDEMLDEFVSDSLIGVLKNDYNDRVIRDERIERI
jgi:hypothetical protein